MEFKVGDHIYCHDNIMKKVLKEAGHPASGRIIQKDGRRTYPYAVGYGPGEDDRYRIQVGGLEKTFQIIKDIEFIN